MQRIETIARLREVIKAWKREGQTIGFVPTMGNLHQGHMSLLEAAVERSDRVIASIFVNPTQFGPEEDYSAYPRTLEADSRLLQDAGCHALLAPSVDEVYPGGSEQAAHVIVPVVTDGLCGAARPGHFDGVATVVTKFFNMVQPDLSVFGEKDYQQFMVIRKMTRDLSLPVEIVPAQTVREPSGLACSSRNQYLSEQQFVQASAIYRTLCWLRDQICDGVNPIDACAAARATIEEAGLITEYVELRRADDLGEVTEADAHLVALAAARLGKARLIDNVRFQRKRC